MTGACAHQHTHGQTDEQADRYTGRQTNRQAEADSREQVGQTSRRRATFSLNRGEARESDCPLSCKAKSMSPRVPVPVLLPPRFSYLRLMTETVPRLGDLECSIPESGI